MGTTFHSACSSTRIKMTVQGDKTQHLIIHIAFINYSIPIDMVSYIRGYYEKKETGSKNYF
jgi:hypothetical protein